MLYVCLESEDLFSSLSWLVHDARQLVVVLHHVFHHVRLVAFQGQPEPVHLHDGVQQVQVLGAALLLQRADEVDDGLDLLREDLEAGDLVTDERLQQSISTMK